MIDIKIGNKTIQKAGIIYISPDGNDNNSGTKESPVKTYQKAIRLCGNNYAIFFMKGTHTLNFTRIGNSIEDTYALFTNNFKTSNGNYNIYNLLIFSNPIETKIICNQNFAPNQDVCFIYERGNIYLYNLNIEINCNLNNTRTFYLLWGTYTYQTTVWLYNCIIKMNVINTYYNRYYFYGNMSINNTIIYMNVSMSISGYENNSILYNISGGTNTNSSELTSTSTDFETIEKEAKALCTDSMGIYSGDYSEWIQATKNYILYINNKYNYIEDNELKEISSIQDAYNSNSSYKFDNIKNNLSLLDKLKYIIIRFIKTVKY